MMTAKKHSTAWKRSIQPRKQRKYRLLAPLHLKQKLLHAHLSKELRQKYGRRQIQIHRGDKVKIAVGQFKKKEGKVERVDLKIEKLFVSGVEFLKKDGTKILAPIVASNVIIIELDLSDKIRQKKLENKTSKASPQGKKEIEKKEKK